MDIKRDPLPPHYRWNFRVLLVDIASFGAGLAFISVSSVLPAFVGQLTDSAPVIGLVGTVFQGCWMLPQLIAARLVSDKPRKKPTMLAGLVGRVTLWAIALALWAGLARYPAAMLALFFVCLGLFSASDGITGVVWFDIVARAIPLQRRGRLMGTGQIIGRLAGIGAGALIGFILAHYTFPGNYTLIFTLAGAAFIPSTIAVILLREPPPEGKAQETQNQKGRDWLKGLVADRDFRHVMGCRILIAMTGLATPFYVKYAQDRLHLPKQVIGGFVTAEMLAGIVASAGMGLISERWGPRYVIRIAGIAAAIAPLFALVTHLAGDGWLASAYPLIYVALGTLNASFMLGFFNYLLEIAPPGMRPTYVGLSNTIMGILSIVPTAGGWLLKASSYPTLFGIAGVLVTAGFLWSLGLRRPQPREGQA
jgi:MFS family permease